jgi:2-(1,2-epoxy-1,2-dihydrophenyl)acetyl-CoA isomerase
LVASANVDLVRSIYAAWGRGDFGSVAWADPEIEFVIVGGPDPGSWTGVAGMTEGWRQWLSAWVDYHAEPDEYRELDDEHVLVLGRMRGRGRTSGVDVENEFANVLSIRDRKVIQLCLYSSRERALIDLLREGYEGWARGS